MFLQPAAEEQRLPITVGTSGQQENTQMSPSEHVANSANSSLLLMGSLQVAEIADSSVISHASATRSGGERLQRLPSTVGTSGQLGNAQMGPSEHAANLSKFDSLSMSSLHVVEKVIHTAVRPASEPCDEERHLLYQADAVDAVGSWVLKLGFVSPRCKLCKL